MKNIHLVVLACFVCLVCISDRREVCRSEEIGSLDRLRSEYQRGLEKVKSLFATIHGSGTLTEEYSIGTSMHRTITSTIEFARKPGMFKCIFHDTAMRDKKGVVTYRPGGALCYNNSLSFKLKKPATAGPYVITSTGGANQDETRSILNISRMSKFTDAPYWMAGGLGGPTIIDYLANPEIQLERSEPVVMNNKTLLKIYFKYKPAHQIIDTVKKPSANRLESGWLLVSPNENWIVYQEEVHYTRMGDTSSMQLFSVEYKGEHSGALLPKRAQSKTVVRIYNDKKEMKLGDGTIIHDGDVASIDTFEFDDLNFDEVPDREFTLPAFGLPDLGSPDRLVRRDYSFVWMFVVAFLALIAALGLKYYASRTDPQRGAGSTA